MYVIHVIGQLAFSLCFFNLACFRSSAISNILSTGGILEQMEKREGDGWLSATQKKAASLLSSKLCYIVTYQPQSHRGWCGTVGPSGSAAADDDVGVGRGGGGGAEDPNGAHHIAKGSEDDVVVVVVDASSFCCCCCCRWCCWVFTSISFCGTILSIPSHCAANLYCFVSSWGKQN